MEIGKYVNQVHDQLSAAAAGGGPEAEALAERLLPAVEPSVRLVLLDALADAAAEITTDLVPGSVDVRLRGGEPEFVVTAPPPEVVAASVAEPVAARPVGADDGDDELARINLRLPAGLKVRVEEAAARDGLSVNAWLVRALGAAVAPAGPSPTSRRRVPRGGEGFTGWVR